MPANCSLLGVAEEAIIQARLTTPLRVSFISFCLLTLSPRVLLAQVGTKPAAVSSPISTGAQTPAAVTIASPTPAASPTPKMPVTNSKPLELKNVRFAIGSYEISGMAMVSGKLRMVSDNKDDTYLYELKEKAPNRLEVVKGKDLKKLIGFQMYSKHIPQDKNNKLKAARQDFEGIASCGANMYVIDERSRNVLRFRTDSGFERLNIVFNEVKGLYDGGENAGFEGVAVDCDKKLLYVAKERQPRFILKIDLAKLKILEQTDVIDPTAKNPVIRGTLAKDSILDFSDLAFDKGYLYALSRNERDLIKIDPSTWKIVDRRGYGFVENGMYDSGEPYGVAEALAMKSDEILIGIDNNQTNLSKDAATKYGVSGNGGAVMYFKRPAGF